MEAGSQLYRSGKITNWKAVGGSALHGAVTGAVAGFTAGTSLLATATASGVANAVGGAVSNAVQGKKISIRSVSTDVVVGAAFSGVIYGANALIKSSGGRIITSGVQHGTELHWNTINDVAKGLAKKGETVYVNKQINTALGKIEGIGNWRPDILSINKKGMINIVEVVSPSQTENQIISKVEIMLNALKKQGYKVVSKIYSENGKIIK